jgi:hypothetical protein
MNTDTMQISTVADAGSAASSRSSFFAIPGDPGIPMLVRVYGTIIRMANAVMIAVAALGFLAAVGGAVPGAAVMCVVQMMISGVLFAVGTSLRNGSRAAVHGVAALAIFDILVVSAVATTLPQGGVIFASTAIVLVALILAPPVIVAYRNWDRFH